MKKILLLLGVSILCLCGCSKGNGIAFLGNLDSSISKNDEIDYTFASPKMTSSDLYKIADQDAIGKTMDSSAKFSKIVKKSSLVVVRVGWYDISPLLKVDPRINQIEYDEELLERQLAILNYNLFHLFDEIVAIRRNIKIYSVGCFNPYSLEEPEELLFKTVLNSINASIIDAGLDYNVSYIDVSNVKSEQSAHLKIMEYVI